MAKYQQILDFHASAVEQNSPVLTPTQKRVQVEENTEVINVERKKNEFFTVWARKVWPDKLSPQLVRDWTDLENRSCLDMTEASFNKQTANKQKVIT